MLPKTVILKIERKGKTEKGYWRCQCTKNYWQVMVQVSQIFSLSWAGGSHICKCCLFRPKPASVICLDFSDLPIYCEGQSDNIDIFILFLFAALLLKNPNLLFQMRKLSLWQIYLYHYWLSLLENGTIALLCFCLSGVLDFFFEWTYPRYLVVPKGWIHLFWSYWYMPGLNINQEMT